MVTRALLPGFKDLFKDFFKVVYDSGNRLDWIAVFLFDNFTGNIKENNNG